MATIRKVGKKHRAEVFRNGRRLSATCSSKTEAMAWAIAAEDELRAGGCAPGVGDKLFGEALRRYADEVSPKKRAIGGRSSA